MHALRQLSQDPDVQEEEELTAAESDSDPGGQPTRDIKLRPRKQVSFNLDDAPTADETFQVHILN